MSLIESNQMIFQRLPHLLRYFVPFFIYFYLDFDFILYFWFHQLIKAIVKVYFLFLYFEFIFPSGSYFD